MNSHKRREQGPSGAGPRGAAMSGVAKCASVLGSVRGQTCKDHGGVSNILFVVTRDA
jgi:hypothetical protein